MTDVFTAENKWTVKVDRRGRALVLPGKTPPWAQQSTVRKDLKNADLFPEQ